MTNKRLTLMPLLAASMLITACSGSKPQANVKVPQLKKPVAPKVVQIKPKAQIKRIPVVFAFHAYPNPRKWGLSKPDTNIDHRRVYNLRQFFQRRGAALPITHNPRNYKPGDIVSWMVGPDLPHIGIVVNKRSKADPNRLMVVHNISRGPQLEDMLFAFPITGHYRYTPAQMGNIPSGTYVKNTNSTRHRGMSYEQLVQAANLLGTNAKSNKQNPVDQMNTVNSSPTRVNNSLSLANLSNAEIQSLLVK